jgi:hypothetical protein
MQIVLALRRHVIGETSQIDVEIPSGGTELGRVVLHNKIGFIGSRSGPLTPVAARDGACLAIIRESD